RTPRPARRRPGPSRTAGWYAAWRESWPHTSRRPLGGSGGGPAPGERDGCRAEDNSLAVMMDGCGRRAELHPAARSQEAGHLGLRNSPFSDAEHEIHQRVVRGVDAVTIQAQKDEAALRSRALVAIDERVVPHQMKQVRGGLLLE